MEPLTRGGRFPCAAHKRALCPPIALMQNFDIYACDHRNVIALGSMGEIIFPDVCDAHTIPRTTESFENMFYESQNTRTKRPLMTHIE
jgi:hypothetical protein